MGVVLSHSFLLTLFNIHWTAGCARLAKELELALCFTWSCKGTFWNMICYCNPQMEHDRTLCFTLSQKQLKLNAKLPWVTNLESLWGAGSRGALAYCTGWLAMLSPCGILTPMRAYHLSYLCSFYSYPNNDSFHVKWEEKIRLIPS